MLSRFFVSSVCTVTLLACLSAAPAAAQTIDKQVYFTFSAPVSLPGITLPAGSYLFRVVDTLSGGNVVQVSSADAMRHYGFFLVNRSWMPVTPVKPEIRLIETPTKFAQAIRAYWYPGDRTGFEFIYPKKQAERLFAGGVKVSEPEPIVSAAEAESNPELPTDAVLD